MVSPLDRQWGALLPNSSVWTGIIGMLALGEVDMACAALSITIERQQVIDYSKPVYNALNTLYHRATDNYQGLNFWAYVDVMLKISWTFTAVATVLVGTAFLVIALSNVERLHEDRDTEKFSLFNAAALVFMLIMQRDYPITKKAACQPR